MSWECCLELVRETSGKEQSDPAHETREDVAAIKILIFGESDRLGTGR